MAALNCIVDVPLKAQIIYHLGQVQRQRAICFALEKALNRRLQVMISVLPDSRVLTTSREFAGRPIATLGLISVGSQTSLNERLWAASMFDKP